MPGRRRLQSAAAALVLLSLVVLAGCRRGGGDELRLDGSPRFPDVEGVVEAVSFERITLDGDRTYEVTRKLKSFSTYDRETLPMLQSEGRYVQLGLDGKTVEWLAIVGTVVRRRPPVVHYTGLLLRTDDDGRLIFRDGTVLSLGKGVRSPVKDGNVRVEIDPERHVVRTVAVT